MAPSCAVMTSRPGVFVVAEELAGDGLTLDAGHEEAGRAEGVVAQGVDFRDGDAGLVGGFKQAVFQVAGHEAGAAALIAAEDQGEGLRVAVCVLYDGVEGPGLAGGAAGERWRSRMSTGARYGGAGGRRRGRRRVRRGSFGLDHGL